MQRTVPSVALGSGYCGGQARKGMPRHTGGPEKPVLNSSGKILKIIKEDRWGILRNPCTRIKNKIVAIASFCGSQCIQKLYQFKLRG